MRQTRKDGGPAFPSRYTTNSNGMTLRDWFAGHAVGRIFNEEMADQNLTVHQSAAVSAAWAYAIADAMISEREKDDT